MEMAVAGWTWGVTRSVLSNRQNQMGKARWSRRRVARPMNVSHVFVHPPYYNYLGCLIFNPPISCPPQTQFMASDGGWCSLRIEMKITQENGPCRTLHLRLLFLCALACRLLLQRSLNPPLPLPSAVPPFGSLYGDRFCETLLSCGLLLRTNLLSLFVTLSQSTHR